MAPPSRPGGFMIIISEVVEASDIAASVRFWVRNTYKFSPKWYLRSIVTNWRSSLGKLLSCCSNNFSSLLVWETIIWSVYFRFFTLSRIADRRSLIWFLKLVVSGFSPCVSVPIILACSCRLAIWLIMLIITGSVTPTVDGKIIWSKEFSSFK